MNGPAPLAPLLLFLVLLLCPGCGTPHDLHGARDTLSTADRAAFAALPYASPAQAADLRATLAASAAPDAAEAVALGEITKGMSAADALRAWRDPDSAMRPFIIASGREECWYYTHATLPTLSLWLLDGRVHRASFRASGSVPFVREGKTGWLKVWPPPEKFADSF